MSSRMSHCDFAGAPRRHRHKRGLALAAAAVLLAAAPVATPWATDLSTVPLPTYTVGSTVDIKPNILMVLDDSGSMDFDYLPDWVNSKPANYLVPTPGMGADTWTVDSNGNPKEPHVPGSNIWNNNRWNPSGVPQYLFYNSQFNGVAYNPAVVYSAPVTFAADGSKDTTTYPRMTGMTAATGADTSKTLPNWSNVLNDGFKVQRPWIIDSSNQGSTTSTSSLMDNRNSYFYTTIAGEYCDSPALTNCKTTSVPDGKFAYAAPLRWCKDDALTNCRGLQGGSDNYVYPRIPAPRIATITFAMGNSNSGSITSLKVDGLEIMSASSGSFSNNATGLAAAVRDKINECTYAKTGNCTTVGYFAMVSASDAKIITIYAPGRPTGAPVPVKAGTATITTTISSSFATDKTPYPDFKGSSGVRSTNVVPGDTLRTVLTKTTTSYTYPGAAAKASTRTDCADANFCTWAEEMTNYATWWAYYRTRMQMMKSATSRAFAGLDSDSDITNGTTRYRVGFVTINTNTDADFVNITDFDKAQKVTWYTQMFKSYPNNSTPLREALSKAGRLYAGKLNGATFPGAPNAPKVVDPLQYSCQKNFTILSTDGYWNSNGTGSKLDGSTKVDNQDGAFSRPYSDGSITKKQKSDSLLQKRTETQVAEKGTLQKQVSQLQRRTIDLQFQTASLVQTNTRPVESRGQLQQQTSLVEKRTANLTRTNYKLQRSTDSGGTWVDNTTCRPSNSSNTGTTRCRYVQTTVDTAAATCPLSAKSTGNGANWNATPVDCVYNAFSGYVNQGVNGSCTVVAKDTTGTFQTAVECRYANSGTFGAWTDVSSCTYMNQQTNTADGAVWPMGSKCQYRTASTTTVGSCTVVTASSGTGNGTTWNVQTPVVCSYGTADAPTNPGSCTIKTANPGSANGDTWPTKTACTYSAYGAWTNVSPAGGNCSRVAPSTGTANNTVYGVQTPVECRYNPTPNAWVNVVAPTCSPIAQSAGPNYSPAAECQSAQLGYNNSTSCIPTTVADVNGQTFQCRYNWAASAATQTCVPLDPLDFSEPTVYRNCTSNPGANNWVNASSCTITAPAANGQYTNCRYDAWGAWSDLSSCTEVPQDIGPVFTVGTARTCRNLVTANENSDTLADVAAYYYNTDLRDSAQTGADATGTCTSAVKDANGNPLDLCTNNVPGFGRDLIPAQHMTTHTLGLGVTGYMVYSPYQNDLQGNRVYRPDYWTQDTGDFNSVMNGVTAAPSTGVCPWETAGQICNWPTPANNTAPNIDDLWHAAVNGHGTYFSAQDPTSLADSLSVVLNQITNTPRPGTAAAAASSNPNITSSDNFVFSSSYRSIDWFGELIMQRFNVDGTLTPQQWSATRLLDCAMTPREAGRKYSVGDVYKVGTNCYLVMQEYTTTGSFDTAVDGPKVAKLVSGPVTRKIYTAAGSTLVNFAYDNLTATQKGYFDKGYLLQSAGGLSQFCVSGATCLSATQQDAADGDALIDFLKGDRTNEGSLFRTRAHILGDIVSSEARYVKVPLQTYADSGYPAFKTKMADRLPTVYVGANDGMLHAFDADTGQERWGFVPPAVLPNIHRLADLNYNNQHRYFVDGTPEVGDICPTAPTTVCTKDEWKTILVGGLNQGGKAYYALDVTDPAAPKFLWEFTDANMGFTYSNPRITKLSDGTWVVIVASGYNNADGKGHLYVLNANSGALIRDISTGAGTAAAPSGLARLAARSSTAATNNTVEQVYGGDLNGNLWRFDVNDKIGASGYEALRLVTFRDGSGNAQAITAKPTVAQTPDGYPLVIVGTGLYLGTSDLKTTNAYSMYAVKDKLDSTSLTSPRDSGSKFVQQTLTVGTCPNGAPSTTCQQGQQVRMVSANTVDWTSKDGWFIDFPIGGERSVTDATLALGTLVFTTIKPQSATADELAGCKGSDTEINAKSFLYYLDYLTGGAVDGTKNVVGEELCTCIATRPSVVKTQSGNVEGIIRTSGGNGSPTGAGDAGGVEGGGGGSTDMGSTQRQDLPYEASGAAARRISYRELNGQ